MASAEETPPSHEYECTVVVDWEGSLGLILGVNRSTGLAAVTSVVPGGPLSKRYPGLLEQHAELWSIDDVAFAAFPAHGKAELKSHAELKAYVTSMEGQADVDDAAVATMWKEIDVNGDGIITVDEFLATMAKTSLSSIMNQLATRPRPYRLTFGLGALRRTVRVDWDGPLGCGLGIDGTFGSVVVQTIASDGMMHSKHSETLQVGDHIAAIGSHIFHPFPAHDGVALHNTDELAAFMTQLRSSVVGGGSPGITITLTGDPVRVPPTSAEVEARWKTLDVNGDGVISMKEFLATAADDMHARIVAILAETPRPFSMTCVRVVPKADLDRWDEELHREAAAAVERINLADLTRTQVQAWLQNGGHGVFCDSFTKAMVTGEMLVAGGAQALVIKYDVLFSGSAAQRAALVDAVASARHDGVSVLTLHHFGAVATHLGTRYQIDAHDEHSDAHELITVHLEVPRGGAPSSGKILAHVHGYISMLEVAIPDGLHTGDKFVVTVSKGHMDEVELEGVGGGISQTGFGHVGPQPPAPEHPLKALGRTALFHVTSGRVAAFHPPPRHKLSKEESLKKMQLLVQCRMLGKRWRRRTKARWNANASTRAAREAERAETAARNAKANGALREARRLSGSSTSIAEQNAAALKEVTGAFDALEGRGAASRAGSVAANEEGAPASDLTEMPLRASSGEAEAFSYAALKEDEMHSGAGGEAGAGGGTSGIAAALAEATGGDHYCYRDGEGTCHGPFPLRDLVEWMQQGYLSVEDAVFASEAVEATASLTLSEAMATHGFESVVDPDAAAAEYSYCDEADASIVHGPFPLADIIAWAQDGFFESSALIFRAGSTVEEAISLGDAAASAGMRIFDAASGTAISGTGSSAADREWFYPDESNAATMHGPYTLEELFAWYVSGALGAQEGIHRGSAEAPAQMLREALVAAGFECGEAWFYITGDETHGPFSLDELVEWKEAGYFDDQLPVFREGDQPCTLRKAIGTREAQAGAEAFV